MNQSLQSKLADALERVRSLARRQVLKSAKLRRPDRELLTQRGYLREIFKGWYLLSRPLDKEGESTAWYGAFWDFLSVYLEDRFGSSYCLSAASSVDLHIGSNLIPRQVIVVAAHGGTTSLSLPHNTSVLVYQDAANLPRTAEIVHGIRVMPLVSALCRMPPVFFQSQPLDAEIALRGVKSTDALTRAILEAGSPALAARFIGAYQFLGDTARASEITQVLLAAGLDVQPENPFAKPAPVIPGPRRLPSPYAARIEALFSNLRQPVLDAFQDLPPTPVPEPVSYLERLEAVYEHDAYNSLSIEGYRVTPELIEKIRAGAWNPEGNPHDRQQVDAMAAKGYLEAFRRVKQSIACVLHGRLPGAVFRQDYQDWYRALFSASVQAGLLESHHLAGHRNAPVYIRASRHIPPPAEAVNDALATLLDVLEKETSPIVRAVLGHWLFGYIHPYMDGNGRMARFLMNLMMASGGYPWTIVRTARRREYLDALEAASVEQNIVPFAQFLRQEMSIDWSKESPRAHPQA